MTSLFRSAFRSSWPKTATPAAFSPCRASFQGCFDALQQHRYSSSSAAATRTAIVTGSANGIGRAIAVRLARDGFDVCVNDLPSNAEQLESVVSEIQSIGRSAIAAYGDVATYTDVASMVSASVDALGPLSVMVANAGIARARPILEISDPELKRMWDVNIGGVFHCDQAAAKQFIAQGSGGRIINAGSGASYRADPMIAHYCATKAAVRSLTQSFAIALGPHNITVNAYGPGIVDTNMWDVIDEGMAGMEGGLPRGQNFHKHPISLGRTSVPDDPAKLVSWLASPEAEYVSGQTILIDGGLVFS
ncbi:NAD(P)-binding protein [Cylindrobasidium torrendii FP15055 ss-10]|uniref:NAD(P)-binding protein n=1 Tax=Cylindrobasidium torrendii FP15055 ss-10 TaxID=1314674 RepID=A0A0D7BCQ0_9AGAR|nr:NAD(P)-binding protein [Cylindrobasidium torrendii FP15055 ss-10]